jgi:hypothetical protein
MNILYKIFSILFISFAALSCNDFLDEEPLGRITEGGFFNDEVNAISAVNACYSPLTWGQNGLTLPLGFAHSYEFWIGDVITDDAVKGSTSGDLQDVTALEEWTSTANNANIATFWYNPYAGIYRTNIVINNIEDGTINQALKDRLMGEAKFMRAYYYFFLVKMFGGVPLFETPITPDQIKEKNFTRASIGEVYELINRDLNDAIALLPEKSSYASVDMGRATRGAARAYLARAYMYQLGTVNTLDITWDDVYNQTNAIIASGEYALTPNYATIFEMEGENNVESIFEIQAIESAQTGWQSGAGNFETRVQNPFGTWGWGFNNPTQSLYDAFEVNDPRRENTIFSEGDRAHGIEIDVNAGGRSATGFLHRKVILEPDLLPADGANSPQNVRKFRYADILLMQAEAEVNRTGGSVGEAQRLLNLVRERARNSTFPKGYTSTNPSGYDETQFTNNLADVTATGQALLEAIWNERRVEFGMESLRFWDLVRTGRFLDAIEDLYGSDVRARAQSRSLTDGSVNPVPLLPVPAVDVAAWGVTQNKGY